MNQKMLHTASATLLLVAGLMIQQASTADDWLPPADESLPADSAENPGEENAGSGFSGDSGLSSLKGWTDIYLDQGSKTRSRVFGLTTAWSTSIDAWQLVSNADLDYVWLRPEPGNQPRWRLGLRELYARRSASDWWVEFGRINVRNGVAQGYNPSDFSRAGAISVTRTRDPQRLRESRLGAVQLRAGSRFLGSQWVASISPSIHDSERIRWYDPRFGAVNGGESQQSIDVTLPRWQGIFSQLMWQHRGDGRNSFGANINAGIGQSAIVYAELASTRRTALASLARGLDSRDERVQQWAAGLTYTTDARITLGFEWQHNGAGLSRSDWQQMSAPQVGLAMQDAAANSDPLSRNSLMLTLLWERFGLRDADLNCLWRRNQSDHSQLTWCEWRYKGDADEWSVALSRQHGNARAEFGILQQSWAMAMRWRHYW